jgi:hypothetical protein
MPDRRLLVDGETPERALSVELAHEPGEADIPAVAG